MFAAMKKLSQICLTVCVLPVIAGIIVSSTLMVHAQDWVVMESEEFDVQFEVPANWETEAEGDTVTSYGNGIVFVLTAVKDDSISTEDLFYAQVDALDIDSEGEIDDIELRGGILGILGAGVGEIDGEVVGIMLLAATMDDNNYLAYIFAAPRKFERKADLIADVITSLAPLGYEE